MAVTSVSIIDVPLNEAKEFAFSSATSASDGFTINYTGADNRLAFLIQNTASNASGTMTFKAGDAIQGVEDVVVTVSASTTMAIWIDSGMIKNVANANKGKVVAIPSATTMKISAVHLGRIGSSSISY